MVTSMVVIGDHRKHSHFTFTGRPGKEKKKSPQVGNIPDIDRAKMPESIICIKIIFPKVYSYIMVLVFEKEQYCHKKSKGEKLPVDQPSNQSSLATSYGREMRKLSMITLI